MKLKILNQLDFSTLLFDTLFGLVLFYGFDSLLDLKSPINFVFYLFSTFIVIHWWLMFKSADDIFSEEVTDSAADLVIGIIDVILLDYIVVLSRSASFTNAIFYLLALFILDLIWALVWRYVGEWGTEDKARIKLMENRLDKNIWLNALIICLLVALIIANHFIASSIFVLAYILIYALYTILTFSTRILDIDIF